MKFYKLKTLEECLKTHRAFTGTMSNSFLFYLDDDSMHAFPAEWSPALGNIIKFDETNCSWTYGKNIKGHLDNDWMDIVECEVFVNENPEYFL